MSYSEIHVLARLDYPSAPVMFLSTLAICAFIFVGGWLFRNAGARDLRERQEFNQRARQPAEHKEKPDETGPN